MCPVKNKNATSWNHLLETSLLLSDERMTWPRVFIGMLECLLQMLMAQKDVCGLAVSGFGGKAAVFLNTSGHLLVICLFKVPHNAWMVECTEAKPLTGPTTCTCTGYCQSPAQRGLLHFLSCSCYHSMNFIEGRMNLLSFYIKSLLLYYARYGTDL